MTNNTPSIETDENTETAETDESTADRLRRRADHLCELAASIERALVLALGDIDPTCDAPLRQQLGERLLARNLHQLHQAADEVRLTAYHFRQQADRFDRTARHAA